jgi:hypothetical protein
VAAAYVAGDATVELRVPWEVVADLVAWRQVPLRAGLATVSATWLDRVLARLYAQRLRAALAVAERLWPYTDDRLTAVAHAALAHHHRGPHTPPARIIDGRASHLLTLADIDSVCVLRLAHGYRRTGALLSVYLSVCVLVQWAMGA